MSERMSPLTPGREWQPVVPIAAPGGDHTHQTDADAAYVATSETTTSDAFTDLATVGPAVTVTVRPSGALQVSVYARLQSSTAGNSALMGFALSGANTLAASATSAIEYLAYTAGAIIRIGATFIITGLTAGSTTVTAKYRREFGGTATFQDRRISAVAL